LNACWPRSSPAPRKNAASTPTKAWDTERRRQPQIAINGIGRPADARSIGEHDTAMTRNPIETIMGALVLLVAAVFLVFAYTTADLRQVKGYPVTARFTKVGGLSVGGDVRIAGIQVGSVTAQELDPETFEAVVRMNVLERVRLPADTRAIISSDGLLGGSYVKLVPGSAETMLEAGAELDRTEDYQSLEDLVGEIIFLATQPSGGGGS
jgi:phospholipid/cholesterol/gamma-HCH transport system substrate-binding protein